MFGVTNIDHINPYLMFLLSACAELLGYTLCYVNTWLGTRRTLGVLMCITALVYVIITIISELMTEPSFSSVFTLKNLLLISLGLVGKCTLSGAYTIMYLFTSDAYPVEARSTALLFFNSVAGLTSVVAPQINLLKSLIWSPLPYIIYSTCAFVTCVCIMLTPKPMHIDECQQDKTKNQIRP